MAERSGRLERLAHAAIALSVMLPIAADAVESGPELARLSSYAAPDRQPILLEGAKREGAVNLFTSIPVPDITPVMDAFMKKYGVRVTVWRSGSEEILQRIVTEAKGGRYEVDAIDTNGPEMEALYREQLLQTIDSPVFNNLRPGAVRPH